MDFLFFELFLFAVIISNVQYIGCFCNVKRNAVSSPHREIFSPSSPERCREVTIGAFTSPRSFLIIFDDPTPLINCLSDNINFFDETGYLVLNYCKEKTEKGILFAQHISKSLFANFIYGGLNDGLFSMSFQYVISNPPANTAAPAVSFFSNPPPVSFFTNPPPVSFFTNPPAVTFNPPISFATVPPAISFNPNPPTISYNPNPPTISFVTIPPSVTFNQNPLLPKTCGSPEVPFLQNGLRIIGGSPVNPNSHPWQAYLTDSRGGMTCGGSLINNQWVITAAHCVETFGSYRVYLGAHDIRSQSESTRKIIRISKVVKHTGFDLTRRLENDIALLKLETPVTFNREISPICLQTRRVASNTLAMVSGWGQTYDGGPVSRILNQASLFIRDYSYCRSLGMLTDGTQICAGNIALSSGGVKDSCRGDSGGPLSVKESDGKHYLYGIVSYGGQFCNGIGVYTNVVSYLDWINTQMRNN